MPAETPSRNESEHALAEHIRAERMRFVHAQSVLPIVFSPLAAVILAASLWQAVDQSVLLSWTAGLIALAVLRVGTHLGFGQAVAGVREVRRWEQVFIGSIMLVDLWWGIGALFLLSPDPLIVDAVVFCFVTLMAGGHTASYSAHPFTVVAGVLALTVPITVRFGLEPDTFHRAMAFVALMFIAANLRSIRSLGYFFVRTYRLAHELQREKARAEELASTDFLTGLNNRRAFYELGEAALADLRRHGQPGCVLMLDIDHFKSVNDRYGHAGGDVVIRAMADLVRTHARDGDIAGRLGGEEFALILPRTTLDQARAIGERIRAEAEALRVTYEQHRIAFTSSLGVSEAPERATLDQWIVRADDALYLAKQQGRNRIVSAMPLIGGAITLRSS